MKPTADPKIAFKDADVALLVGARPRGPGMERKDLLEANGKIFAPQGQALSEVASRDVKVLVVGNPANTNCLIAMKNAPKLKPSNFSAMMRLDHNRALTQVAQKVKKPVSSVRKMTIWGNHSATQYPDLFQAEADGKKVWPMINDQAWLEKDFIPTIQKRGAAIIDARGLSSAASAASAAMNHIRDWVHGTPEGDWVSMGLPSDGSYGIAEGVIYGYPATCRDGRYQIVQGLEVSEFSKSAHAGDAEGAARGARLDQTAPRLEKVDIRRSDGGEPQMTRQRSLPSLQTEEIGCALRHGRRQHRALHGRPHRQRSQLPRLRHTRYRRAAASSRKSRIC